MNDHAANVRSGVEVKEVVRKGGNHHAFGMCGSPIKSGCHSSIGS
jgi:hypothetical protein